MRSGILHLATATALTLALSISAANAQKKYDPGASDTEIKVGQTMPFSGPASAYSSIGKTQAAYFKMINDRGGINGRKINLIQYDDAYSPPKAVEQVRKLVENDEVAHLTFQIIGKASNTAVQKYLDSKKVLQLFAATGASRFIGMYPVGTHTVFFGAAIGEEVHQENFEGLIYRHGKLMVPQILSEIGA